MYRMIRRLGKGFLGLLAVAALAVAPRPGERDAGSAQAGEAPLSPALEQLWTDRLPPTPAPQTGFTVLRDGVEQTVTLEAFAGEVVLLNFWATWCAPCIEEMPWLDQLQADLGPEGLEVVAVSLDRAGLRKVEPFFTDLRLDDLTIYLDPKGRLGRALEVRGLPTSYLIDRQGRVVGGLQGAFDWAGPEAKALIRHYLE